ncbi:hypothetical protein FA15DRAFT_664528 [Coprinopsis marcescibilis]|uniref:Uncharacterized protein n=1 Tax=Coprinopsis marcescibilis TaxID=230819 RepID=A0A5C3LKL4_COPMA|nr:hypothetical protein FA15DRAFT_664528 [Coprinopsis marcescibilis]
MSYPGSSSTTTISSQTPMLAQAASQQKGKNYEAAFGQLASAYGFGAPVAIPTVPKKSSPPLASASPLPSPGSSSTRSESFVSKLFKKPSGSQNTMPPSQGYEGALGSLSSKYGLGSLAAPPSFKQ